MSFADKCACAELIQAWGLYRDQGRWNDLLATFHPGGAIHVSWFRGPFAEFVEKSCRGGPSKHHILPSIVRVKGERALAETSITILVRQEIDGVLCDMTSRARFLDRLERRQSTWKMLERAAIYEQDRLDPVVPSDAFDRMMQAAAMSDYPAAYRYMAFRIVAAGRSLALPIHYDGAPHTRELYSRYEAWLAAGSN
jgi:SnoaL-like domain